MHEYQVPTQKTLNLKISKEKTLSNFWCTGPIKTKNNVLIFFEYAKHAEINEIDKQVKRRIHLHAEFICMHPNKYKKWNWTKKCLKVVNLIKVQTNLWKTGLKKNSKNTECIVHAPFGCIKELLCIKKSKKKALQAYYCNVMCAFVNFCL